MPPDYDISPVTLDDVEDYVRCHLECLGETYATLMPPEFFDQHWRDLDAALSRTRESWQAALARPDPSTTSWLARDRDGQALGVARSGVGLQDWEVQLQAPPAPVPFQLHHLYTRRATFGSGLGRALLEASVGDRDAYLWILEGNPRADRFYRRHGFVPDQTSMNCGPSWYYRPEYRLVRRSAGPTPAS